MRRFVVVVVSFAVGVACNALTGIGDLDPSLDAVDAPNRPGDDGTTSGGGDGGEGGSPCGSTTDDPANCGRCGNVCPSGFACTAGACTCSSPKTACGGDAGVPASGDGGVGGDAGDGGGVVAGPLVCTDLATDPNNCNACGAACSIPNAVAKCAAGSCALDTCSAGFTDCDGEAKNGCECPSDSCITATKQCAKRVFITSALYKGDFGGLAGADARCQQRAVAASLPGTYKAWLSTAASSPSNRFTKATIPYRLVDGTLIATSYTDLTDGTIAAPINKTETGGAAPQVMFCYPDFVRPWSSTLANGTFSAPSGNCTDWTVQTGSAHWGAGGSTTSEWSQACSGGTCAFDAPLYCFQQ